MELKYESHEQRGEGTLGYSLVRSRHLDLLRLWTFTSTWRQATASPCYSQKDLRGGVQTLHFADEETEAMACLGSPEFP